MSPGRQTQSSEKQREKSPHNGSERCFASRTRQTSSHSLHNPGGTRMQSCVVSAQLKGRDKQRWRGPANENKCPHHLSIALALPCSASISGGVGSWSLSPFEHDSAKTRVGAVHGTALRWRYQASMAPPYVSSSLQAHWQQPTRTPQQFPAWTAIGRQQVILFRSLRPLPLSLRL
jgi:hypothetical protein